MQGAKYRAITTQVPLLCSLYKTRRCLVSSLPLLYITLFLSNPDCLINKKINNNNDSSPDLLVTEGCWAYVTGFCICVIVTQYRSAANVAANVLCASVQSRGLHLHSAWNAVTYSDLYRAIKVTIIFLCLVSWLVQSLPVSPI